MDIRVEAPNLLRRYQEGAAFRQYVQRRTPLVFASLVVMLTLSLATTAGMVVYFGDIHTWRVLAGLILAPFLLVGSLFVQGFVFFSWLEQRAIDEVSGRTRPPREQIPPIPWLLVAIFVAAPLLVLALLSPKLAALLLLIAICTPLAYSFLDR